MTNVVIVNDIKKPMGILLVSKNWIFFAEI